MKMITLQIRKHKFPFARNYNPTEDKLIGEFTSLKELLQTYKTLGCSTRNHYMTLTEKGIPPVLIDPVTRHFLAVGITKAQPDIKRAKPKQQGGWRGEEV